MTENIFLITLVVLAIIGFSAKTAAGGGLVWVFSLVSSFVYLLYGAPDVAIAEAIIGSTITTVYIWWHCVNIRFFIFTIPATSMIKILNAVKTIRPF